ncbi:MAG: hypothetical protein QOG68_1572, partial [Solirubrobacteraceae bacterium]|nr:hypothetical protein [Solirubrobacteraceae bacterium]
MAAWTLVPPAARLAVSRALGSDDRAFWWRDGRAANPSQHFAVRARAGGVAVSSARGTFGLSLRSAGVAGLPVVAAAPRIRENRIVYARGSLTEWYANGPLGLEQGV